MKLWDWTLFNIYLWINFSTSALSGMLLFLFKLTVYNLAKALRCCFECLYWFLKCSFATHQLSFNTQIHNKTTIYWSLCQKLAKKNISKVDVLYCFTELKSESLACGAWVVVHSLCGHCSLVQLRDWRSSPWQSLPPVPGEGWVHSLLLHIEQSAPHADHLLHSLQPPSTRKNNIKNKNNSGETHAQQLKLKRILFKQFISARSG